VCWVRRQEQWQRTREGIEQGEAEWGSPRPLQGGAPVVFIGKGRCSGGLHRQVRVLTAPGMKEVVRDGRIEVRGGRSVELTGEAAMAAAATNPMAAMVLRRPTVAGGGMVWEIEAVAVTVVLKRGARRGEKEGGGPVRRCPGRGRRRGYGAGTTRARGR
jgi:hypothetical protein